MNDQHLRDLETAQITLEMTARDIVARRMAEGATNLGDIDPAEALTTLSLLDQEAFDIFTMRRSHTLLQVIIGVSMTMHGSPGLSMGDLIAGLNAAVSEGLILGMLVERARHEKAPTA
jgi:hypothetical protein